MDIPLGLFYLLTAKHLSLSRHIQIGIVCYWTFAITAVTVFARSTSPYSLWGPWELRYFFIQQKLFWLLLAVSGTVYLTFLQPKVKGFIYLIALSGYIFLLLSYNQGQFQTSPNEGRRLASFLQTVEEEQNTGTPNDLPVELVLTRDCFDIHIRVP